MLSQTVSGTFSADDGYGNKTTGTISQKYEVVQGQAKLSESKTDSKTVNHDGSTQQQSLTVTYQYDPGSGMLLAAQGSGTFSSDDGLGNTTTGTISQKYAAVHGQAKLTDRR